MSLKAAHPSKWEIWLKNWKFKLKEIEGDRCKEDHPQHLPIMPRNSKVWDLWKTQMPAPDLEGLCLKIEKIQCSQIAFPCYLCLTLTFLDINTEWVNILPGTTFSQFILSAFKSLIVFQKLELFFKVQFISTWFANGWASVHGSIQSWAISVEWCEE